MYEINWHICRKHVRANVYGEEEDENENVLCTKDLVAIDGGESATNLEQEQLHNEVTASEIKIDNLIDDEKIFGSHDISLDTI